jgi:EmrB/QacA subfamily drug resistance transporter
VYFPISVVLSCEIKNIMNQRSKWAILSGVILAMLLSSLDQTIVSTAMPTIVQELHGLEHISWVFTAYMLGSTVTVPIYGKLSDLFGRKKLYLIAIGIFLGGSVLCGLSQTMTQLIIFRGLQGIGGGAIMVNSFAIIGDVFPPAERGKYQGIMGAVFGLSSVAGPLLGGWITDNASWRWVFYVNIPLGIIAIFVLISSLPLIKPHIHNKKIDWWGGLFILLTLVPLLLSLVWGGSIYAWTSWPILTGLCIGMISLYIFIRIEKKAINPILSLDLFRNRVFVVSVAAMFMTAMGMFGAIMYVPIFSQGVVGGTATHAGLVLTPMMISLIVSSIVSGQIISRTGKYKIMAITGTIITTSALLFFSTVNAATTNIELIIRMSILGIGLGSTMPIFTLAVQSAFGKERMGEVTAGTQLFRSVGGTVGTAVLGGIMNSQLSSRMDVLQSHPFVVQLQRMNLPGASAAHFNGGIIQTVLNPTAQLHIRSLIDQLPGDHTVAMGYFNGFIISAKSAFSNSIDAVFIVAAILMAITLIIVCFLREIPLRKSDRPAAEEAAVRLEDELAQSDEESQPRVQGQ